MGRFIDSDEILAKGMRQFHLDRVKALREDPSLSSALGCTLEAAEETVGERGYSIPVLGRIFGYFDDKYFRKWERIHDEVDHSRNWW